MYFAVNPDYSSDSVFAPPDQRGRCYMYQARVLVGNSCKGQNTLIEPPLLDESSWERYDSISGFDRSVYAIFRDGYAYPEYLITMRADDWS